MTAYEPHPQTGQLRQVAHDHAELGDMTPVFGTSVLGRPAKSRSCRLRRPRLARARPVSTVLQVYPGRPARGSTTRLWRTRGPASGGQIRYSSGWAESEAEQAWDRADAGCQGYVSVRACTVSPQPYAAADSRGAPLTPSTREEPM